MKNTLDSINKIVHLPDLQFVQFCQDKYGINRGIYNTVEHWFYTNNLVEIVPRRKQILQFLHFISVSTKGGKIKFGHGGLSYYLYVYWNQKQDSILADQTKKGLSHNR